jgi:hypothetical protein
VERLTTSGRRTALVFAACWAITGAAFCALAFSDGFVAGQPFATSPAWLDGPFGAVLTVLGILYAFFWLCLPVVLLVVGNVQILNTTSGGWRWPVLWTAVVLAGVTLDPVILWANGNSYAGDGFDWRWLAITLCYLAAGAVLTIILRRLSTGVGRSVDGMPSG